MLALCAVFLDSCGFWPNTSYRYKLTLELDTPEGIKTASSVVELDYYKTADGNLPRRAHGQSLVLDLGARGAIVALVVQIRFGKWNQTDSSGLLWTKCGNGQQPVEYVQVIESIKICKTPFRLRPSEQPDLIYFKDAQNPKTGVLVNPLNTEPTSLDPMLK